MYKSKLATVVNEQVNPNQTVQEHWSNTAKALTRDDTTCASASFTHKQTISNKSSKTYKNNHPYTITAHDYELNLPSDAYITSIHFNVRMRVNGAGRVPIPVGRFCIYGSAWADKTDNTKTPSTGWENGVYQVYKDGTIATTWTDYTYSMHEADVIKGGFSIDDLNESVMGLDLMFADANWDGVNKNHSINVYIAYVEMIVYYLVPSYNITYKPIWIVDPYGNDTKTPITGGMMTVEATYTQSTKGRGGMQYLDVLIPNGTVLVDATAYGSSVFDQSTMKWRVPANGVQTAKLRMDLKLNAYGHSNITIGNESTKYFDYDYDVVRGIITGYDTVKMSIRDDEIRMNHKTCIGVDITGHTESATTLRFDLTSDKLMSGGTWVMEYSSGVSVNSDSTSNILYIDVPSGTWVAYLRYCFYPNAMGKYTFTLTDFNMDDTTLSFDVDSPYVYLLEPREDSGIIIKNHRIISEIDTGDVFIESKTSDGDAIMIQEECSLRMNYDEEVDYIGCVPLEQTHFDPQSTYKDTLLDTHYKNKRYMGKKLASDEDISLNVRLHPKQVTTIQGLIDMDKPIPINTNHKAFESDALNHRGWAEIYSIKTTQTGNNPHWYKCDIDVKYLTHNLNTRFKIDKGVKVSTYECPNLMSETVASGTNLSTATDYFEVETDGTFVYNEDETVTIDGTTETIEIPDNQRNMFGIDNGQSIHIRTKNPLTNNSTVSFEWSSIRLSEDKENNVERIIQLIDKDTQQPVFKYQYTDFIFGEDSVKCSIIYEVFRNGGWIPSESDPIDLRLEDIIFDDDEMEIDDEQSFGSLVLFNINNNVLSIIDEGYNSREFEATVELPQGSYYWETNWKNRNEDAESEDVDCFFDIMLMDTVLTSQYSDYYSKLYVSPFPVVDKKVVFTRNAEEGTIYYLEEDDSEFSYIMNPYYQYKNGTDLVNGDDGSSIFSLNYGYELVYIQNGLVRLGFARTSDKGKMYLGKYDPKSKRYIDIITLQLGKYMDVDVNSITDDKIEIQASDCLFTIWRGHPYIMVNHQSEDILIDDKFYKVWAEQVGGDNPLDLPAFWDLMNSSNLLPSCVDEFDLNCLDAREVKVMDRTASNLAYTTRTVSSETVPKIDVIRKSGSTESYIDRGSTTTDLMTSDYIVFEVTGSVSNTSEEVQLKKDKFGLYTTQTTSFGVMEIEESVDPTVPRVIDGLSVYSNKDVIQATDTATIKATLLDNVNEGIPNKRVDFYELLVPTITLTGDKAVMQTGDTLTLSARVKDEDGSLAKDVRVDYYEEFTPIFNLSSDKSIIQSGSRADLSATVRKSTNHSLDVGETVWFYETYTPNYTMSSDKSIIQSSERADISVKVKDNDGSIVKGGKIWFYVEE